MGQVYMATRELIANLRKRGLSDSQLIDLIKHMAAEGELSLMNGSQEGGLWLWDKSESSEYLLEPPNNPGVYDLVRYYGSCYVNTPDE